MTNKLLKHSNHHRHSNSLWRSFWPNLVTMMFKKFLILLGHSNCYEGQYLMQCSKLRIYPIKSIFFHDYDYFYVTNKLLKHSNHHRHSNSLWRSFWPNLVTMMFKKFLILLGHLNYYEDQYLLQCSKLRIFKEQFPQNDTLKIKNKKTFSRHMTL